MIYDTLELKRTSFIISILEFFKNQDVLEYRKRMRILRVKNLDKMVKALMVDDAHTVGQLMVTICQAFELTNHEEYSLIWENYQQVNMVWGGIFRKIPIYMVK